MKTPSWTRLLILFTAVSVIEAMFYGNLSSFIPLHLPDLGISRADVTAWTGAITAVASLVGIPLVPIWGTLADRFSRKAIIVRSFVIHVLAVVVMLLAPNVWVFAAGRAMLGLANGDTALMLATMGERAPGHRLGFAFAVINGSLSVGAFSGALIGGPIFDRYGFSTLLALLGALLFGVVIALLVGYKEPARHRATRPILALALESLQAITQSPRLRTLFAGQLVIGSGWMLVMTFVPLFITSLYTGPDPGTTVGIVMAVGGVGTLVLGPLIGSLADRIGFWRTLLASLGILIGLFAALGFVVSLVSFMAFWALLNGVMSSVNSISFNVVSEAVDDDMRGRVMAFAYLPLNFGSFIGPAIGGVITGFGLSAIFPAAAALSALGLVCMARARQVGGARYS